MRNSLWAILITDALCMPVHWYYDLRALDRDFGYLNTYADPKDTHPTTTTKMLLKESSDPTVDIIGKKILHNKRDLYKKKRNASVQIRSSSVTNLRATKESKSPMKKPVWGSPRHRSPSKKEIPRHLMNMPRSRLNELPEPIRGFVGANELQGLKKGSFLISMFT